MKKLMLLLALSSACANPLMAQEQTDILPKPKTKKFEHKIGVQANELIRQVFNFSNTASNINNPYLLIYSGNHIRTGLGIRGGVGYTLRNIADDNGINKLETHINDVSARFGLEKSFRLSDKWSAGAGLDFVYSNANNETKNVLNSFDSVTTVTKTLVSNYGGGPMVWLRYHITPRILIGTETSVYYTTGIDKQTIEITRKEFSPGPNPKPQFKTTISQTDNKLSDMIMSPPVAIYLIVNF
jgi:hypothetical protein